jgi:hypothetical protein
VPAKVPAPADLSDGLGLDSLGQSFALELAEPRRQVPQVEAVARATVMGGGLVAGAVELEELPTMGSFEESGWQEALVLAAVVQAEQAQAVGVPVEQV